MAEHFWTQAQDIGPSPRAGAAMATEAGGTRTLLFGGHNSTHLGDTWAWDGRLWTQVDDIGPSPRSRSAMAVSGRGPILFGGETASGAAADTWLRADGHWTQIADTGPAGRAWSRMVAVAPDRLLLFGGEDAAGATMDDTWTLTGNSWTQVADTGPSPRSGHAMAFDEVRNRVVLFGGWDGSATKSDTWEWDGSAWLQVQDTGPGPLLGAVAVAAGGVTYLFGGKSAGGAAITAAGDTWSWDGALWTHIQDIGPAARWDAAASVGPSNTMVVFGGISSSAEFGADTWTLQVAAGGAPDPDPGVPDPDGPVPPDPDPQNAGLFTLSVPGPFAQGSPLGAVVVEFSNPPSVQTPFEVTVDGGVLGPQPWTAASPGELTSVAVFALPPVSGEFVVRVSALDSFAETTVSVISSAETVQTVEFTPSTVPPGGTVNFYAVLSSLPSTSHFQLVPLDIGLGWIAPVTVEPSMSSCAGTFTVPPEALPGVYRVLAMVMSGAVYVTTEQLIYVA